MILEKAVVTPSDFKNMFAQDLANLLGGSANDSNYPYIFLRLVQDFLIEWCAYNGFRRMKSINEMNEEQLNSFQKAVLYQTYYVIKTGSAGLGLDSGYDSERGVVISETDLKRVAVPERVVMLLHSSGLFNLNVKNRPRVGRGYPWTGEFSQDN